MSKIKVEQPFSVRLDDRAELLAFTVGVHEVDADVLKHWFVQACIADGRAVLLDEAAVAPAPDAPLTEETLRGMTNRALTALAQACELDVPEKATKDQLVALLLPAIPAAQGQA